MSYNRAILSATGLIKSAKKYLLTVSTRRRFAMTQTTAIALFVLVVDSLLYLKTVLYPPTHP